MRFVLDTNLLGRSSPQDLAKQVCRAAGGAVISKTMTIAELEAQALQLSPEDRANLADKLLSSLAIDPSSEDAWSQVIDRRIAEFESGGTCDVPIKDSIARARAAIR